MDKLTADRRSDNMSRIRSKDTTPELMIRRLAHSMGYRYRLHAKNLPGKPDLIFPSRRKVIFVHGCFWHSHTECPDGHVPKSRLPYWVPKLERNRRRDASNQKALQDLGWMTLILWECELADLEAVQKRLINFLD
jgi:DNA mismatch endonuclease (patch repair protein)